MGILDIAVRKGYVGDFIPNPLTGDIVPRPLLRFAAALSRGEAKKGV